MSGHHHHHHHHHYATISPRLHRNTSATPPLHHPPVFTSPIDYQGSGMSSRTGPNTKSSMSRQSVSYGNHNFQHSSHTFGLQPIPFVIPHGPNMGYFYYQTGIDQQNCHTSTSAKPWADPQQTHVSSTATPHPAQHAHFPVQPPMFPPAVPHAQFASPHGGSFHVPGNYAYMPNAFQCQATMRPQAFQTMTAQDPFWYMDTRASSHLADNTGIRGLARMEEVAVSAPVQECLDMDPKNRKKNRRKLKMKRHSNLASLDKQEDTENPNTIIDAIASVDQEMIVTSPAANGDGKNVISSTDAPDKTASRVICGPPAIVDKQMTVLSLAPVQECLVMETDKTALQEICSPAATADQKMMVLAPADTVDGKSSISGTNAPDKTASQDICSPAATADQKMIVLTPADTVDGKSSISSTNAPDKTASQEICSPAATADQKVIVLTPADTVDGKSSISGTKAPDKTASHDILGPAAIVDQQTTVLSPAPVQDCLVMETDKDEVSAKLTKTRKRNRRKKPRSKWNKNLESLDQPEDTENPNTSLGAIASVDPKMSTKVHEAVSGETGSGKTVTDSTTSKKRKRNQRAKKKVAGDVLSAKVNEVVSGETVPSKTTTNNTTPKKKKRNRKRRKLKTVAGDILSTCENIQDKVNAIEGSSATEVTEAISGEMVLGKTSLPCVKMVSKEEEQTEAANGKMRSSTTTNLNVKGAVNSSITIGEILTPQNLQNLKADNGETGSSTTAADTTASKKRKRGKKKKNSPLSGDILSTCENIQDKVNAIDCLSTTKVLDTKVTNKTELSDITNHNVDGKKGPDVVNSEIDASNRTLKQKTRKQKVDVTQGKKLIIFEVNGMLADIVFPCPKDVEADEYSHGEAVFKRPYLDDFLSFCFEKFNVGIWSSRMRKNLDQVVHWLFGDLTRKLLFTWDAFHCRNSRWMTLEDRDKCIVFKELRKIWEKNGRSWLKGTFNESNTLLLDDSPYKALLNPKHTGIFPTSYKYTDMNDDCLGPTGALRAYLEGFAAADDGRTYVEQNPFGQGPIDEMNRDWKYYSRVLKCQKLYCTSRGLTEVTQATSGEMALGEDPSEIIDITQATLGKKLIIFDVNGMLADNVFSRPQDVEADKYSHGKAVFKRPYLDDFLSFCFEKFNVCIWSSTMKKNLDPVVDCLFGDLKKKLLFIWDASHCRNPGMRTLEDRYKCNVCKELRKIWEKNCRSWLKVTFHGSKTLLLDDSPYKALLNPKHTGIFPTSYKYTDTNDDCLGFNMEIWRKFVNELHELLVNSDWDQLSMGTDIVCMECGKDMVPELREKGICMNKENFGTYEAMDSYAREYDIAGAKGKECGWIYE